MAFKALEDLIQSLMNRMGIVEREAPNATNLTTGTVHKDRLPSTLNDTTIPNLTVSNNLGVHTIRMENVLVGRQGDGHLLMAAQTDDGSSGSDLHFLNDGTLRTRAGGAGGQYRNFPFATAVGRTAISGTGTTTITFPGGRFTQAPRVTAQVVDSGGVVSLVWISAAPTTTGFVARIYALAGTQRAGTIEWHAIQMTPTSAD